MSIHALSVCVEKLMSLKMYNIVYFHILSIIDVFREPCPLLDT